MAQFTCEQCGASFVRWRSGARPIRFCCGACYQAFRAATGYNKASTFKFGFVPWNKGVKGIHLSQATEFKKGSVSLTVVPIGTMRVRKGKNGTPRRHIKVAEPNVWRLYAVVLYEQAHGPVPAGWVVHHRDHNALNDVADNLQALTRSQHIEVHRSDLNRARGLELAQRGSTQMELGV